MPDFTVRVTGLQEVLAQFEVLPDRLEPAITRGLTVAASEAVQQIDESISTSYPPESLPGQPPHARTGTLLRSVRIERIEPLSVTVAVGGEGTNAPYASWLEFGTSKMEPRPFIAPVVQRIAPDVANVVADEITKELPEALR